ncbi:peptide chain release factor H [Chitinophaga sancti]|uniref:Peptide chain release factor n=1 Tax=Chitinophaga sancti TaxID=1004 RepID=A0A1K1PK22_9BACT|nr:peptide chain release factor H [Chitinophaga sancti]WQD59464.1 peptide chain release factor H [Chitinophaga sancti]WQG88402.1 peptide chain release factor H [Chitinophaga sancti]SFW47797.1 peptide chain release factor [Chitinophaga sancti]
MDKAIIQITAGRGPAECSRVVAKVTEKLFAQCRKAGIEIELLDSTPGDLKGTFLSTLISVSGDIDSLSKEWSGTVQWISKSPYRKFHKRKNWFVGVAFFDIAKQMQFNMADVRMETCRASGPGGQNVNKVETAVRGTHIPSGIQVLAMDSRSQWENKQLCLKRLEAKVQAWQGEKLIQQQQEQWQEHNELERGRAVKTIEEVL